MDRLIVEGWAIDPSRVVTSIPLMPLTSASAASGHSDCIRSRVSACRANAFSNGSPFPPAGPGGR